MPTVLIDKNINIHEQVIESMKVLGNPVSIKDVALVIYGFDGKIPLELRLAMTQLLDNKTIQLTSKGKYTLI